MLVDVLLNEAYFSAQIESVSINVIYLSIHNMDKTSSTEKQFEITLLIS